MDTTTCLTSIILLLAAFSATTVGQIETTTTTPAATTTETPAQDSPNNFFGTSSEDSLLSEQGTAIAGLTVRTDDQSATSPPSPGNSLGAASPNDIFGTENQKLNDIEADKLTKTEVHTPPESAAGIEMSVLTRNETTTLAPTLPSTTETGLSSLGAFVTTGSTEESASSSTDETTTSSQDGDDGATSASSTVPVTSRTLSPDVTTPYGSEGTTGSAFAATNVPNALQETSSPESYATQPVHSSPFAIDQADALSQSASLPSSYGPLATQGALEIPSDGAYGGYPNNPAELSTGAAAPDQVATGPFHTPNSYSEPQGTNIPSYLSTIDANSGILPGHATDYTDPGYSSAIVGNRGPTFFSSRGPTVRLRLPFGNVGASVQIHKHDVTSEPPTHATTDVVQTSDSGASLLTSAGESTTEGTTNAVPFTTTQYVYTDDTGSTESPTEHESTDSQHHSEQTNSTEKPDEEATTITHHTSLHDSATDVPTTESSVAPEHVGNRAKMGRARTMEETTDVSSNDVDDAAKGLSGASVYTPSAETASPITSNPESVPSATGGDEPTTVSPAESTVTSMGKTEHATTATAETSTTGIIGTSAADVTQTSSEGVTESPVAIETSTPVIITASEATSAAMSQTTTAHWTSTEEGTSPETTEASPSQDQAEIATSNPEKATSSPVTDRTTEKVTDKVTTTPTDLSTQGVTQSTEESEVSSQSDVGGSIDSSTQSPDVVPDTPEGPQAVTTEAATTESLTTPSAETSRAELSTGETSTSGYSEQTTRDGVTAMTPAGTEHPKHEVSQQTQTSLSDSATTEIAEPVGREELATQGVLNGEETTPTSPEESTAHTAEGATPMSEQPETTKLPTYETTTTPSPAISTEGDGNAATTPAAVYRPGESTTPPAETATTMEAESAAPGAETTTPTAAITTRSTAETTTPTFETTTPPPAAETTAAPAAESTAPSAAETTEPTAVETTESPAAETTEPSAAETTEPSAAATTEPPAVETTESTAVETTGPPAAETTEPPAAETTEQPTAETTTPAPEIATQAVDTTTRTVETTTAVKAEPETTPTVGEVTMPSIGADFTTGAVSDVTTTTPVETTTLANAQTTEPPVDAGAETEGTSVSSASRSPKQLSESTPASLPEWSTQPSTEHDHKHSFTTAPDLFSTTQEYTSWEASTTHDPSSVEPVGREITNREPWNTYPTTVSTIQDWKPSTEAPVYTSGSPTSTTTEGDESCIIMDGSLPVRCLLPEELNHTVTVKFGDLNQTRAEIFRAEARVWLLDYCNKNGIPIGEPTVVFLPRNSHMDTITFFVVNNTRGSVVPSDTVVAVLTNMKLTFEDRLGTAITDVFYGLPIVHKTDEPRTTFLGSSLGLVYVIVGAAVAALLLLALLVVIMVKCRTLSSNQYSPDSEKLTKDLHMRAEMGDLRPADEILKEEAQLKEAINGNGTHINGDGWVVPYSQIVSERKDKPDAQDTRL